MNFEGNQNRFINSKHLGVQVIKGSLHTGKTSAALYRTMNLKNNYCLYESDKIVFVTNNHRNKINAKSFYDSTVKKIKTSNITNVIKLRNKYYSYGTEYVYKYIPVLFLYNNLHILIFIKILEKA
ncbi:hypothetical protein [Clostridium manihotivorum]|uniref:Uncharacterized protein n=1 Tax=Clostridium manihotivorum TaxID=2320868 RepID=A0A410DQW2_9CLOT|nr:hypothetical protein [Clostridium manihotivorum]QAA31479.1 hypothetical protein C1I91_07425 [Clostridium manihotivorum]